MKRSAVAIVGSAGAAPRELRRSVEAPARARGDAGFDLVAGAWTAPVLGRLEPDDGETATRLHRRR